MECGWPSSGGMKIGGRALVEALGAVVVVLIPNDDDKAKNVGRRAHGVSVQTDTCIRTCMLVYGIYNMPLHVLFCCGESCWSAALHNGCFVGVSVA
jgi:hypothetical protein